MKLISFLQIILLITTSSLLSQNYRINDYRLSLNLQPAERKMHCTALVSVICDSGYLPGKIELELKYDRINFIQNDEGEKLTITETDNGIILTPPAQDLNELKFNIDYESTFTGTVSNNINEKNSWLLFESDYYPQVSNSFFKGNKFTFSLSVTAPNHFTTAANGTLIGIDSTGAESTYRFESKEPVATISLSSAVYSVTEKQAGKIRVKFYLYPQHKNMSDSLTALFLDVMSFYQEKFGAYYTDEFKIVETDRRGGYGPAGMMFLNTGLTENFNNQTMFVCAHEVAHQWFPGKTMIGGEAYYLNESFAQYFAYKYFDEIGMSFKIMEARKVIPVLNVKLEMSVVEFLRFAYHSVYEEFPLAEISIPGSREYTWAGYYKGFYFLRYLALNAGVESFDIMLSEILEANKFRTVLIDNLMSAYSILCKCDTEEISDDWIYSDKQMDLSLSGIEYETMAGGNYNNIVSVSNNGELSGSFELLLTTESGNTINASERICRPSEKYSYVLNEKIVRAEIDPRWYNLDANRVNNFYPRKTTINFLYANPSITENQLFYYPSFTFGLKDKIRLGMWATNRYTIVPDALVKNFNPFQWRLGVFYGVGSKRFGISADIETNYGMPDFRWNWSAELNNYRGAENYGIGITHKFVFDPNHGKLNTIGLKIGYRTIYEIDYYDERDYEEGNNFSLTADWEKLNYYAKSKIVLEAGTEVLDAHYNYLKITLEAEDFLKSFSLNLHPRIFVGFIRGDMPLQQSIFLYGKNTINNYPFWFVDPDKKTGTQMHLHQKGDANLRGYTGYHIKGENGLGVNVDYNLDFFNEIKLFADIGNVWNKKFGRLKYDAGIGIDLKIIKLDFPFYISDPIKGDNQFDFRWLITFGFFY